MKRYILTGAPGCGKTAILRQLEVDGFSVVEEAATDVIALWQAQGIAEPWRRPEFVDAIACLQRTREGRASRRSREAQFHDRSVACTQALARYLESPGSAFLAEELARIRKEKVFQKQVFFIRSLGFITPTEARTISMEEALRFEVLHEQVYQELGFEIVSIGPGNVPDRAREIVAAIKAISNRQPQPRRTRDSLQTTDH
jgi:predicted ATPase